MKPFILSIAAFATLVSANEYGTINGELRAFSFDRSFDKPNTPDSEAVTVGGIIRYTTPPVFNLSAQVAYYTSLNTGIHSDETGKSSALLASDGSNIGFIGEANIRLNTPEMQIVYGRQQLSTPLANNHDLRLLPSVYHGVTAQYKPYGLEAGHITKYSGFGSKYDGLQDIPSFTYLMHTSKYITAQFIQSEPRDYYYAEANYAINDLSLRAQFGANDNTVGKDSQMYGVKATYALPHQSSVALLANKINGNRWLAIESGAMYSDWMQGYGLYEPSKAYGFQLTNQFKSLSTTLGAVRVADGIVDNYVEYQADFIYQINKANKARLRYSEKHQDSESLREDRNDLRIIYYYAF